MDLSAVIGLDALCFDYVRIPSGRFRVARLGEGPIVMLLHGFPESWYSWRHVMRRLRDAGYCVLAPDIRGYGESYNPHDPDAYSIEELTNDVSALIAHYGAPAALVGHDHGAPIAWITALRFPHLLRGVAGLSIPYMPPGPRPALEEFKSFFTDRDLFFYQVYFQEIGLAEAEFEADMASTLVKFYYALSGEAPDGTWPTDKKHGDTLGHRLVCKRPNWLLEAELNYYISQFKISGFHGPLNRYRNHQTDHAFLTSFSDSQIYVPSLYIGGRRDLALKMFRGDIIEAMKHHLRDLRGVHLIDGCGHWTQQEEPEIVSTYLLDWLTHI